MMKERPQDQTNHCPMCEDAAKKILELEQRVKVLTDALEPFVRESRDYVSGGNKQLVKMVRDGERALNQSPKQTAAQIERGHVEWMMKLPVAAWGTQGEILAAEPDDYPFEVCVKNGCTPLYQIPPLPNESKE